MHGLGSGHAVLGRELRKPCQGREGREDRLALALALWLALLLKWLQGFPLLLLAASKPPPHGRAEQLGFLASWRFVRLALLHLGVWTVESVETGE